MKNYIDGKISARAVNAFVKKHSDCNGKELHTLQIRTADKILVRYASAPYSCDDKREVYSLSKSFCATAIGLLIDDGKLDYSTKIADIFPEAVSYAYDSDKMSRLTVENVMSMNSGHGTCTFMQLAASLDPIKTYFAQEQPYEPGTHFVYSTGNTYVLSLIVERITKMRLFDFLQLRLFSKLGISGISWSTTDIGANEGGIGLHVSSDDIAKFGQLYLCDGVYNGERLLSHDWIEHSHMPISDNSSNGTPDWTAGYGCQFWVNARQGYRGDGAFGQLCLVLPKYELVVAVQARDCDMQSEMNDIYEMLEHLYDEDDEPLSDFVYPCVKNTLAEFAQDGAVFVADKNKMGINTFSLSSDGDCLVFKYTDGQNEYGITCGNGDWIREQRFSGKYMTPKILYNSLDFPYVNDCAASWHYDAQKNIVLELRFTTMPERIMLTFCFEGEKCVVTRSSDTNFAVTGYNRTLTGKMI